MPYMQAHARVQRALMFWMDNGVLSRDLGRDLRVRRRDERGVGEAALRHLGGFCTEQVGAQQAAPGVLSARRKSLGVEGQDPKTHPPAGLKTLRLSSRHESRLKTQSPPATSFFGGSVFVDKLLTIVNNLSTKKNLSLFAPFCPCIQGQDSKTQGLRVKTLRLTLAADSRL